MDSTCYLNSFLQKNKNTLAKTFDPKETKAKIFSLSEPDLLKAGQLIQQGKLVAFPTETVYGLGADALNEEAVYSIFKAKNRPLTDPVIVHVENSFQALELVDIDEIIKNLFLFLVEKFWPGPLTIIMKAAKIIPPCVTANTGFVGIRCPNNETAQKIIQYSKRPIAAPSANLFSHVSPTSAIHVFNDLYDKEITIIDGENCKFGIESTVVKICVIKKEDNQNSLALSILRNGSVSEKAIYDHLQTSEIYKNVEIFRVKKEKTVEIEENAEAPGQLLKHYSPLCDTFLLEAREKGENGGLLEKSEIILKETVLIDFANVFACLENEVLAYFCLSKEADLLEAMNKLYDSLRWAENLANVKHILITNIDVFFYEQQKNTKMSEFLETVYDKTYRSSSGKKLVYDKEKKEIYIKK